MMKDVPRSEWWTPENNAKWTKMYQEMRNSPDYKRHMAECDRLENELRKYVDTKAARGGSADVAHGYVWLFRRK
jgi:hypothetical protein